MQFYKLHPTTHSVIPINEEQAKTVDPVSVIAQTDVRGFFVSTVFLGIDHDHARINRSYDPCIDVDHKPLIFETMIFDGTGEELYQIRHRDYEQTITWHKAIVAHLAKGKKIKNLPDPPNEEPEEYDVVI